MTVCSRVTSLVASCVPVWVKLYPDHEARSVVSVRGKTTTVKEIQLPDLFALLDQVQEPAPLG